MDEIRQINADEIFLRVLNDSHLLIPKKLLRVMGVPNFIVFDCIPRMNGNPAQLLMYEVRGNGTYSLHIPQEYYDADDERMYAITDGSIMAFLF
jgi:hypothetical protein